MPDLILDANEPPPVLRRKLPDGKVVTERIPRTVGNGRGAVRWRLMLDSYGNDCRVPLTTAAALVRPRGKYSDDKYDAMLRKGWFPYGKCPLASVAAGELSEDHLHEAIHGKRACDAKSTSDYLDADKGLPGPCKHALAEKAVRQKANHAKDRKQALAYKPEAQKLLEQNARDQSEIMSKTLEAVQTQASSGGANADILGAIHKLTEVIAAQNGSKK